MPIRSRLAPRGSCRRHQSSRLSRLGCTFLHHSFQKASVHSSKPTASHSHPFNHFTTSNIAMASSTPAPAPAPSANGTDPANRDGCANPSAAGPESLSELEREVLEEYALLLENLNKVRFWGGGGRSVSMQRVAEVFQCTVVFVFSLKKQICSTPKIWVFSSYRRCSPRSL